MPPATVKGATMSDQTPGYMRGPLAAVIRFCLDQKLVVVMVTLGAVFWGVLAAPFNWDLAAI